MQKHPEKLLPPQQPQSKPLFLSRKMRVFIFTLLILVQFLITLSSGLLSCASKVIKETYNMDDKQFGHFGTATGVGRISGILLFMFTSDRYNRKCIFTLCLIVKSFMLFSFSFTNNPWLLIILRGLLGIVHMPLTLYLPIWIDQFGITKYKTTQMTLMAVFIPIGKVCGFVEFIMFEKYDWRFGFTFEGMLLLAIGVIMVCLPQVYFSKQMISVKKLPNINTTNNSNDSGDSSNNNRVTGFIALSKDEKVSDKQMQPTYKIIFNLISNPIYITAMLTRAFLVGVLTCFHFWISDYMRNALKMNDNSQIVFSYTLMAVAGPVGGVIYNNVVSKCIGGYDTKNAPWILFSIHLLTCVFGVSIPLTTNLNLFRFLAMMFLVFSSSGVPFIQGILLGTVSPQIKGTAFSFANLFHMTTTSGLSPFLYGVINDKYKKWYQGFAMFCIMLGEVIGLGCIFVLAVLKRRQWVKEEKEKEKKKGQEMEEM